MLECDFDLEEDDEEDELGFTIKIKQRWFGSSNHDDTRIEISIFEDGRTMKREFEYNAKRRKYKVAIESMGRIDLCDAQEYYRELMELLHNHKTLLDNAMDVAEWVEINEFGLNIIIGSHVSDGLQSCWSITEKWLEKISWEHD